MHNIEEFRSYCLSKPGVEEGFPFDEHTLVFKVMNKIFAITGLDSVDFKVNLKCDPERAIKLRAEFPDIIPGYHMSKKHWNTIYFDRDLEATFLITLIDDSYDLVVAKLTKKDQNFLNSLKDYPN